MFKSRKQTWILLAAVGLLCSCNDKPTQNKPPKPDFKELIVKSWAVDEYRSDDTLYHKVLDTNTHPEYSYTGFKYWENGDVKYYEYTHDSGGCGVGAIEYYYGKWQITDSILEETMTRKIFGHSAYKFISFSKILELTDSTMVLEVDTVRSKVIN